MFAYNVFEDVIDEYSKLNNSKRYVIAINLKANFVKTYLRQTNM
jgi:hypothetical protein